jgi:hypothetical protein
VLRYVILCAEFRSSKLGVELDELCGAEDPKLRFVLGELSLVFFLQVGCAAHPDLRHDGREHEILHIR